jgi:hypothetical protein
LIANVPAPVFTIPVTCDGFAIGARNSKPVFTSVLKVVTPGANVAGAFNTNVPVPVSPTPTIEPKVNAFSDVTFPNVCNRAFDANVTPPVPNPLVVIPAAV